MGFMDDPINALEPIPPFARGALRHEVMRRLLRAIFAGSLPAGTRLMVLKLAGRFGISSTPVREALVELDAIGMVEFVHNRGAVVAPFGPKELADIYQIRRILESEAARSATGRIPARELRMLQEETTALVPGAETAEWLDSAVAADRRLHELIASCCPNGRLSREIHRYDVLVQTVRDLIGADRAAQLRAIHEHLAIMDALLAGTADEAAAAMARHIDSSARSAIGALFPGRPA